MPCRCATRFSRRTRKRGGRFNIHIIDSRTYSMCYGWAIIQAARMAAKGADAQEIILQIRDWLDNMRVIFVPLNLRCVKKTGRVSAAAAIVGGLVGVKPLITFENGDSKIIAKVRGTKRAIAAMLEKCAAERRPGIPYIIARGNDLEQYDIFRSACMALLGKPAQEFPLGCIISINAGPQVLGILYMV